MSDNSFARPHVSRCGVLERCRFADSVAVTRHNALKDTVGVVAHDVHGLRYTTRSVALVATPKVTRYNNQSWVAAFVAWARVVAHGLLAHRFAALYTIT